MFVVICIIVYAMSFVFASFALPQIIGSIRMISAGNTSPYVFTLVLWSVIVLVATVLMYIFCSAYFVLYLFGFIIPLISTLRTKNIQ